MKAVVALATFALTARVGAVELTKTDWEEKTAGKSVFVKFLAPWCGHCKSMKPDWDKLMKEYKDHASVVIADVDCTAGGKDLCSDLGVQGYPTIKHGDPNNLEDYEGGRDLKALKAFAKDNLGPTCGPANLDLCDDDKKVQVKQFMGMAPSELSAAIKEKDDEMAAAEKELEDLLKSLQAQYEEATKKKDDTKKEIKESGLGLMKAVLAHLKTQKSEL